MDYKKVLVDLGLFQVDQIAFGVLKIKPLYILPRAMQVVADFTHLDSLLDEILVGCAKI